MHAKIQVQNRTVLEKVRSEISVKLAESRRCAKKRPREEVSGDDNAVTFTGFNSDALVISRASLLADNDDLRQQHKILVEQSKVLTEEDFWSAHERKLADEAAKMHGKVRKGVESAMRSNLDLSVCSTVGGKIRLGVEEIRQIFILYPAVHKAYEEKVPLELSEEQFWRKYLESEYFYRDRGRVVGNSSKTGSTGENLSLSSNNDQSRATVAGAEDIFSRYDVELIRERDEREYASNIGSSSTTQKSGSTLGRNQAVGQFDLSQTLQTERPSLGATDLFPGTHKDSTGARVIKKYNRHWALVMNPERASAGSTFVDVALRPSDAVNADYEIAKVSGGNNEEFKRLVEFASCSEMAADHVRSRGDDGCFDELSLQNLDVYSCKSSNLAGNNDINDKRKMIVLAQTISSKLNSDVVQLYGRSIHEDADFKTSQKNKLVSTVCPFPESKLGHELLVRLSKRMSESTKTDTDLMKLVQSLPDSFRSKIKSFFQRSSELLRHFYGLLTLYEDFTDNEKQKMDRIVEGIKTLYREMEDLRKSLLGSGEKGEEVLHKLCLGIMDQLDWAIKQLQQRS